MQRPYLDLMIMAGMVLAFYAWIRWAANPKTRNPQELKTKKTKYGNSRHKATV